MVNRIRESSIGKTIIRHDIGKYKAWYQRVAVYVAGLNFLMLFYNFTQVNNWMSWYSWLVVFFIALCGVLLVDILFVWESEANTAARKNPVLMEMKEKLDYLYDKEYDR